MGRSMEANKAELKAKYAQAKANGAAVNAARRQPGFLPYTCAHLRRGVMAHAHRGVDGVGGAFGHRFGFSVRLHQNEADPIDY